MELHCISKVLIKEYLNTVFLNRWIVRRGALEWSVRSPDLTPLDFFLLRNKGYQITPANVEQFEDAMAVEMRAPQIFEND